MEIEIDEAEINLIGTIHTSQKSKSIVKKVIRAIRPNYVVMEWLRVHYNGYFKKKTLLSTLISCKEMKVAINGGYEVGARIVLKDD